jgi:predicted GNAT family N-acyltransferase
MGKLSSDDFRLGEPGSDADWAGYFDLRWRVLREPWDQPRGSERDLDDSFAYHLMVRTAAGAVVAVGRLHFNSKDQAQIRFMAVDDRWRVKGLGGRILFGLEAYAEAQGASEIVLNAREDAIPFYIRYGYEVTGPANTLFGSVKHVHMRKAISKT